MPAPPNTGIQSGAITAGAAVIASPVATGSNISQAVNSPTVNVTIPPEPQTTPDWPDVLLQCEWPNMLLGAPGSAAVVPILGAYMVRNRPWSLRHPGSGAVYNVKILDIDFSGYRAHFDAVDVLTDKAEQITAVILESATGQIVPARDLESLIAHPPPSCDISKYTTSGDPLVPRIPVSVTYADKNGNRYGVRYVLHYDYYFEEGRMVRIGGIKKLT
jgi:hypothetical protein